MTGGEGCSLGQHGPCRPPMLVPDMAHSWWWLGGGTRGCDQEPAWEAPGLEGVPGKRWRDRQLPKGPRARVLKHPAFAAWEQTSSLAPAPPGGQDGFLHLCLVAPAVPGSRSLSDKRWSCVVRTPSAEGKDAIFSELQGDSKGVIHLPNSDHTCSRGCRKQL